MVDLLFSLNLGDFWWFTFSCALLYILTLAVHNYLFEVQTTNFVEQEMLDKNFFFQ